MTDSKQKPPAAATPGLEVEQVKDLDLDNAQSADVRGGQAGAGKKIGGLPVRP